MRISCEYRVRAWLASNLVGILKWILGADKVLFEASRYPQGFWREPDTGRIMAGYFSSDSNFHYLCAGLYPVWRRSSATWPMPPMEPLSFEEGFFAWLKEQQKQQQEVDAIRNGN